MQLARRGCNGPSRAWGRQERGWIGRLRYCEMKVAGKEVVKQLLGEVPFTAELYWLLRQRGKPLHSRFSLRHLQAELPAMVQEAEVLRKTAPAGRKVFVFATLHYWIEHAALMGLALSAQGHKVTLGDLPYAEWQ